ncbi:HAMP domain-containing sensor histidine kinase [Methanogenium cariaci]|uniref:sensor histidine kinase n=1 Tax=Methanogenium cariaci TaxID=2197 RepID=UPI0007834461|nr:HAMP domain-containing sensor histidine kinase [Methanogenium cariaci]
MGREKGIKGLFDTLPDKIILEVLLLFILSSISFYLAASVDAFELIYIWCIAYESYELDEIIVASFILLFALMIFSVRRWIEYKNEVRLRMDAERRLTVANKKLLLLTRITRHDIKNKIQAIYLTSEVLSYSDDHKTKEYVSIILNELESIENMIDFTGVYEGLGSNEPQWYTVAGIFKEMRALAETSPVELVTDAACDVEIYADPLFPKAIYNLIENAVRHGEHTTRVSIFCERGSEESLHIHCKDNGAGIPDEIKSSIFKEGFGKNTGGVGLFLIREILSITEIGISEVGIEGEGADFLITVPADGWRN